jgi:DNA topoisomerase-1
MDGNLVLELKARAESELCGAAGSLKPEEAAVLAPLRGRLAKEAERPAPKRQRECAARPPDLTVGH